MIDPTSAAALREIAQRYDDVLHAYDPAFRPHDATLALRAGAPLVPDAGPLSVAPPRGAYVLVRRQGHDALTQAGDFRFVDGELQTRDGASVLGFPGTERTPRKALRDRSTSRYGVWATADPVARLSYLRALVRRSRFGTDANASRHARADRARRAARGHATGAGRRSLRAAARRRPTRQGGRAGGFSRSLHHVRQLGAIDLGAGLDRLREAYARFDALEAAHRSNETAEKTAMDLLK